MLRVPPPSPWKAFGRPDAASSYLVILTNLPVRRLTALPGFLNYTRRIRAQLEAGPEGLVGYSLLAQPLRSNYWTLSAWESPAALGRFMREDPHREAMTQLRTTLRDFHTWRWDAAGSALPPSWDDALARA
ncbi:MAG: hypothetical protein AVDCRST_MAG65-695 [uncultured Solirubrobacteraceae bacterium]|uniref:ABM domain-containing protein n=1 Tax=uncultured Solirubrobacteraceae bacterium TaxID=1162706 RepID=A0A6J4RG09_9ACTN|nr:MAG: hypothetical protein AVDCRST_MAG65-695 [uncultured Solirubrobacteraceae bacterium]